METRLRGTKLRKTKRVGVYRRGEKFPGSLPLKSAAKCGKRVAVSECLEKGNTFSTSPRMEEIYREGRDEFLLLERENVCGACLRKLGGRGGKRRTSLSA